MPSLYLFLRFRESFWRSYHEVDEQDGEEDHGQVETSTHVAPEIFYCLLTVGFDLVVEAHFWLFGAIGKEGSRAVLKDWCKLGVVSVLLYHAGQG